MDTAPPAGSGNDAYPDRHEHGAPHDHHPCPGDHEKAIASDQPHCQKRQADPGTLLVIGSGTMMVSVAMNMVAAAARSAQPCTNIVKRGREWCSHQDIRLMAKSAIRPSQTFDTRRFNTACGNHGSARPPDRGSDAGCLVPNIKARYPSFPTPEFIRPEPPSRVVRPFKQGHVEGFDLDHGATCDALEISIEAGC